MPGGWRTEKQANILRKHGQNSEVPFDTASQVIDALKRNGWKPLPPQYGYAPPAAPPAYPAPQYPIGAPVGQQYPPQQPQYAPPAAPQQNNGGCTEGQAKILAKYHYPTNVSFDTASQILDQLKANNWQPLPGMPAPVQQQQQGPGAPPSYAPPQQQYAPPQAPPQYVPPAAPPQYAPPATPAPQFQNGQAAPWEGQPQFAGVPNFG